MQEFFHQLWFFFFFVSISLFGYGSTLIGDLWESSFALLEWLRILSNLSKNWWTLWILMDVSRNKGTPKWFIMETPIKMDDLGVPLSLETPLYTHNFYSKPIKDKIWRVDTAQNDWPWHHFWFLVQELRCLEPRQISVSKKIHFTHLLSMK